LVDRAAWIALSLTEHVGSRTIDALLHHFAGDTDAIFAATPDALQAVPGVGPKIARGISAIDRAAIARRLAAWERTGVTIITWAHDRHRYPAALLSIADPPATLFALGTLNTLDGLTAGIVGTRRPAPAAAELATRLAYDLARRGILIISGLARGIDAAAHQGAVGAGGRTAAVLGSGVLRIYPPEHGPLAEAIRITGGVLLAEAAPDTPPSSPRLVARNRLISALGRALVVIETGADGGAMHAARRAVEQGRRVCAVDYPADGNQALIAGGALPLAPDLSNLDALTAYITT
jgi:DNA processing protein